MSFVAPREADDRKPGRQKTIALQIDQGRHELAMGKVAGGAEDHQDTRLGMTISPKLFSEWVGHFAPVQPTVGAHHQGFPGM